MTTPSRLAVPLQALDRVRIGLEEQVEAHAADGQPLDAALWGGSLPRAYGQRGSADGGGGGGCDGCGGD